MNNLKSKNIVPVQCKASAGGILLLAERGVCTNRALAIAVVAFTLLCGARLAAKAVISGTSDDLDEYRSAYGTSLPGNERMMDVVAVAIAKNDRVCTWLHDGNGINVIVGTTRDLDAHIGPREVHYPRDKTLVAVAIAKSSDHVYAWYSDWTVSSGTSTNLTKYQDPKGFDLPDGKSPWDIAGIGIARNDRVYAWYRDGTASQGSSTKLRGVRDPYSFSMDRYRTPGQIVGVAIAGSDNHVYAFLDSPVDIIPDRDTCHGHDRVTGRRGLAIKQSTAKLYARRKWRERVRWLMPLSWGQADWDQAKERSYDCDKKAGTWRCAASAIPCAGWP